MMTKQLPVLAFLAAFCAFWVMPAQAQVAVVPATIAGHVQYFDQNGKVLAGGCVFAYNTGTTTPAAIYTSSSGLIQQSNPLVLDATGSGVFFLGPQYYKFVVKTAGGTNCSTGTQLYTIDGIPGAVGSGGGSSAWSAITPGTNGNAGTFLVNGNTWDFGGATKLGVPHSAGNAPTVSASVGYDDTANVWGFGANGSTNFFGLASTAACATHNFVSTPATKTAVAICAQPAASDLSNGVTGSGAAVLATSPALVTPTIGGTTISNVPEMVWTSYDDQVPATGPINRPFSVTDTFGGGIEALTFRATLGQAPSSDCVGGTVIVYDETAAAPVSGATITFSNGVFTYGAAVNTNIPASHALDMRLSAAPTGTCTLVPALANLTLTYRMQ